MDVTGKENEKENEGIRLDEISKTFRKKRILNNISFTVEKGDLFGFLGPNGAGKTTTMRIILGLLAPDTGSVTVGGSDFAASPEIRRRTGVILEGHGLYENMSLIDNLNFYFSLYHQGKDSKRVPKIIEEVGLSRYGEEKVGNFSTGMKKKAALARSLVHKPDYLFLDEPTTGLDPEAQMEFRELIRVLSKDRKVTLFLNSHNLEEVQKICNKVAIVNNGSIVVSDSVEALQDKYSEPAVLITLYSAVDAEEVGKFLEGNDKILRTTVKGATVEAVLKEDNFTLTELLRYGVEIKEFTRRVKSLEEVYMEIV